RALLRDICRHRMGPALKLSNGYILPEGKMTPNTLFVGGIDMKVVFCQILGVKEVKIITYRGAFAKGEYGFIYFSEDVDIQTIVEQPISFKGRKLKLGPAIMKERTSRTLQSHLMPMSPWISPSQSIYCVLSCSGVGVQPNSPVLNTAGPYMQPFPYSSIQSPVIAPLPMSYAQTAYSYQVHTHTHTHTLTHSLIQRHLLDVVMLRFSTLRHTGLENRERDS
uniref:RRM domain-containing protein n=1 Tax=Denticeps clupeoides TaxID=299321 RepID=A0AAY4BGG0_9TELE